MVLLRFHGVGGSIRRIDRRDRLLDRLVDRRLRARFPMMICLISDLITVCLLPSVLSWDPTERFLPSYAFLPSEEGLLQIVTTGTSIKIMFLADLAIGQPPSRSANIGKPSNTDFQAT